MPPIPSFALTRCCRTTVWTHWLVSAYNPKAAGKSEYCVEAP